MSPDFDLAVSDTDVETALRMNCRSTNDTAIHD
jgi:hypothetical protein